MSVLPHISKLKLSIRSIADIAARTSDCIRADLGQTGFTPPKRLSDLLKKYTDKTYYAPTFGTEQLIASVKGFESQKIQKYKKMLALPGFRIGWLVGAEQLIQSVSTVHRAMNSCPNTSAQYVVAELLSNTKLYIKEVREHCKKLTTRLSNILREKDWNTLPPKGGIYVWAQHPKITDGWKYVSELIRKKRIPANPGEAFGPNLVGYIRFAAGALTESEIDEIAQRIEL